MLGITQLSEKAENLKEQVKETKNSIQQEEFRIKAVEDANKRIMEQISATKRRQSLWKKKHEEEVSDLVVALGELNKIDIDVELENHRLRSEYDSNLAVITESNKWLDSISKNLIKETKRKQKLEQEITDIKEHKCYACGTKLHDNNQQEILDSKVNQQQCVLHTLVAD